MLSKPKPRKKRYLLVASFDHTDATHNLSVYCNNRIQRILGKTRGADKDPWVSFTLFDVKEGKIKSFDVSRRQARLGRRLDIHTGYEGELYGQGVQ